MTKRLNSKHKVDRRLKVNLWGRPKSPFNTRAYGPGQHGQTRSSKPSDYGIQLQAKQKLKAYYGNINEKQFRNIYKKANRGKGITGELLLQLCESRLDNVVYRMGISKTRDGARQLVSHKHVLVDGKRVNIPSYRIKPGQEVTLSEKALKLGLVQSTLEQPSVVRPPWISFEAEKSSAKVITLPDRETINFPLEISLVVEFYARSIK